MLKRKRVLVSLPLALIICTAIFALIRPNSPQAAPPNQAGNIAPKIIETSPENGEELDLQRSVEFTFDRPMNMESGGIFSVDPAIEGGVWEWVDGGRILRFSPPLEGYPTDSDLIFSVFAEDTQHVAMESAYRLHVFTTNSLQVSEVLPGNGAANVSTDTVVTVIFNRPVVPLTSIGYQADLVNPVHIEPETAGTGEWLNTSIYTFKPEQGFIGGTTYTITIDAGLKTPTDAVLEEDYQFSFSTVKPTFANARVLNAPRVRHTEEQDEAVERLIAERELFAPFDIPLKPILELSFTQPMNPVTQNGLYIESWDGDRVRMGYSWSMDRRTVRLRTLDTLELDSIYLLVGDEAVLRSMTGAELNNDYLRPLRTVPYPDYYRTYPADGERNVDPGGSFSVFFNAPMDADSIADKIKIDPAPEGEIGGYYEEWRNAYFVIFRSLPNVNYAITLEPGMRDVYGNEITTSAEINFVTRAYEPSLRLNVPGMMAVYNAYDPTTRLFVSHRNIDTIELQLYRLDLPSLAGVARSNSQPDRDNRASQRLRSWQVPVASPLNVSRDRMILISPEEVDRGLEDFACQGVAARRLSVDIEARVTNDDPRPLPVHSEASFGSETVTQYPAGTSFWVQDGPLCAEGYLWWKVKNFEDETEGWIPEGSLSAYFVEPLSDVPLIENGEYKALEPGAYLLYVNSPQSNKRGYPPNAHVMIVATVNITFKYSQHEALAWVTNMQTGNPEPNLLVKFYDSKFSVVAFGRTDENGLVLVDLPKLDTYGTLYAVVQTSEHFGFVSNRLIYGIQPGDFNIQMDYQQSDQRLYLYSDRPVYRPGQTVYFRGILRKQDDVLYTLMPGHRTVPIEIYDASNQKIYEERIEVNPQGTFSGEFKLDAEASLGNYRIAVALPSYQEYYNRYTGYYWNLPGLTFDVAEYHAPEYEVRATPAADEVLMGEMVDVTIDARYFFGGAVSNAQIKWVALGQDYYFNYQGRGRWTFQDFDYDRLDTENYIETTSGVWAEKVSEGEGVTDAEGRFLIQIPAGAANHPGSQVYTIEATVTDESNQPVAGRVRVVVHQGKVYVGVAPDSYLSQAGKTSRFNMIAVDWDSQAVPNQVVEYRIVERRWTSVLEKDTDGRMAWTWDLEEVEVASGSVRLDAEGKGQVEYVPPRGGTYKLYATTRDDAGNEILSSGFMWVSSPEYVSWRQRNDNRVTLIADADDYRPGDTAQILIPSPFQGETLALVTVERDSFLHTEVIHMTTNSYVYQLPIQDLYAPNIYVSVMLIKGVDEHTTYAQFRFGMIPLTIDTERLVMDVEVTPIIPEGVETVGPGDTVALDITTRDWAGNPVSAEVGIGVTDLSVLGLMSPNSPPLLDYFYSRRGLGIMTASTLTISADDYVQYVTNGRKGGGGGGGGYPGIIEIRQDFVDTPLWEPSVITDENGQAQVSITLPDNLTTWHIDARAISTGADGPMLVGQSTADFISTKPLLIRPVTPRFFVVGDELSVGAIVNNNTRQEQIVQVELIGTGFNVLNDVALVQTVTIPANGRQRVDWPIRVLDVSNIDATFTVRNEDGSYTDGSKPLLGQGDERLLPVYRYVAHETVGTAGVLDGPEARRVTETIELPEQADTERGSLRIRLDHTLAGPMLDGLNYLQNYPHQCIEQTVSRFLPNIMTMRALAELNQSNPELKQNLNQQVIFGLQRLYALQHSDGGWGWFPGDASNPLTTAYALIGLSEARNSGFAAVDTSVIERAGDFLYGYIAQQEGSGGLDNLQDWQLNQRAFILYALNRSAYASGLDSATYAARLTLMYEQRHRLNLDAQAFLMMSMMSNDPNDPRLETLKSDFMSAATFAGSASATGIHWEDRPDYYNWTTDTRTTALVLMALAHYDVTNDLLPGAVRWLMTARHADAWETTQETAWSVMSLTDWMLLTRELEANYAFGVDLNGEALLPEDTQVTPETVRESQRLRVEIEELLWDEANQVVITHGEGPGNLYYTLHLTTFLDVPGIEPASRGISIERQYYLADDPTRQLITSAKVGDEVVVMLTITALRSLNYVVIEDPIPAGAEAVDPHLLTTSIVGQRPHLEIPDRADWGWWYFSHTELRDEKVVLYATYLGPGTYTYVYRLRLGLPGQFNVIPATGQEFYFPEVYGRSAGMLFTIEP